MVSIEHTYKKGSSALSLKPTMPARDDSKIAWVAGERTFKTDIFKYDEPSLKESVTMKFDMLTPCRMVLPARCNVP